MNRPERKTATAWLLAILLLAAGCGGGGSSTEEQESPEEGMEGTELEGEFGPEGGEIADEYVSVEVPEGAVPEGETALIRVTGTSPPTTGRAAAFSSAALGAIEVTSSVPLEKPVIIRVILSDNVTTAGGGIVTPLVFAITGQGDGGISAPKNQCMFAEENSGDATLEFECDPTPAGAAPDVISFVGSSVVASGSAQTAVPAPNEGGDGGAIFVGPGDEVDAELDLFQDPSMGADGSSVNVWANGTATADGGSALEPRFEAIGTFELDGVSEVDDITNEVAWDLGDGPIVDVTTPPSIVITLAPDTVLLMGGPVGGAAVQLGDEHCFTYTPFVIPIGHGAGGDPGLPPFPEDETLLLEEADQIEFADDGFPLSAIQGAAPAPVLCAIAYKHGVAVADLTSGTVPDVLDFLQDAPLGSVPMSFVPPGGTRVDALVSYYNTGYGITHFDVASQSYGFTQIDPSSGSVSDVCRYEEDASQATLVQSGSNRVRFIEPITQSSQTFFGVLGIFERNIPSNLFPGASGPVISATRRNGTSPVYFVTHGATPTANGQLWRKNDPTDFVTQATLVGGVGAFPRRIRFAGPIGAVSNSESGTLTILVRDASDNVTIQGTVDVGDGPIGIDLLVLPNGNVGVLSTGFDDHTYTVTILEPDGDVVSNDTSAVPGGGLNPGHAVWANAEGTRIAVSCFGTDEVRIFSIGP